MAFQRTNPTATLLAVVALTTTVFGCGSAVDQLNWRNGSKGDDSLGLQGATTSKAIERPADAGQTQWCGPAAKVLRWIAPFDADDASEEILASDIATYWETKLQGQPGAYDAWVANVDILMNLFADSANRSPSEPFENRGVIGLRNVVLTCDKNGQALGVTYDVDRNPGWTPMTASIPGSETLPKVYHKGEEATPLVDKLVLTGGSAKISVAEKSRLSPPGQWQWTMLLGYGMPWIWESIDYTISCGGAVAVAAKTSSFPSSRLTLGNEVRTFDQKDLIGFVKSGVLHNHDTLYPPGGDAPLGPTWKLGTQCTSAPCKRDDPPAVSGTQVEGYAVEGLDQASQDALVSAVNTMNATISVGTGIVNTVVPAVTTVTLATIDAGKAVAETAKILVAGADTAPVRPQGSCQVFATCKRNTYVNSECGAKLTAPANSPAACAAWVNQFWDNQNDMNAVDQACKSQCTAGLGGAYSLWSSNHDSVGVLWQ